MSEHVRGFRVLMAFGLRAAPWQAVIFLLSAFIMALEGLVVPVGLKLLADAAVALNLRDGLVAAFIIASDRGDRRRQPPVLRDIDLHRRRASGRAD